MKPGSSSLPTSHLSPARAQLHQKVSLGLRASYSSEPAGAAGYRTHFKARLSQSSLCRQEGASRASLGLNSASPGTHMSPQVSSRSKVTPVLDLRIRLCLIPQG